MPRKRWTVGFRSAITYDSDCCPHLCDDPSRDVCDYLSGKGKTVGCSFDICPHQGIPELITYKTPVEEAALDLLAVCKLALAFLDADYDVSDAAMANRDDIVDALRDVVAQADGGGE
jgi:hypothetical protein